MTVETTIQWMFDNYPDLFATRKECYNHLFCVIGNGYVWKRGQIVRCDEYDKPEESTIQEEYDDYASACLAPVARQSEENIKKHDAEMEILRRAGVKEPFWYPISEFSLIKRIPADIKPDWKAAVEECKAMLKEDGIEA